jgi:hypothetical protein
VAAKYIFAILAAGFLGAGIVRGGLSRSQSRTWLLVGGIFAAISGWLWYWR